MSSITQSHTTISQEHKDKGDNVARDKIINEYRELAPKELRKIIDLILSDYRERNIDKAKVRLETIKSTNALSAESETILDMVSICLNLLDEAEKTKSHSSLILFLKNSRDSLASDLCQATLLRLDAENNRTEDARERYQKTNQPGIYTKEAFYELAANDNELEKVYEDERLDLGDSELNGLIRGSFRTDNLKLALTIATRLNTVFPSFNSKVLLLIAKASLLINIDLRETHFWTITSISRAEVMAVIEEVCSLIDESAGKDSRLFNIAAPCLQYTFGHDKNLSNLCWKYVDEIEKTHPEIAAELHNINAKDTSKIENTFYLRHTKAQNDEKYRSQLLSEIYSSKNVSTADFIILKDFSAKNEIRRWVQSGGQVSCQDGLESDFSNIQISLISLSGKSDNKQIEKIRVQTENFIKVYRDKLEKFNPVILLELTEGLLKYTELSSIACDLIKPMLPVSDCWLSPIVKCYIEALLASQQMATLTTILSDISEDERDSFVWQVQARIDEQKGDYEKAIESTEKALHIDPYVLNSWCFLVQQHFLLNASDELFRFILDRVPDSVLSKRSNQAASLIFEIATAGDFPRAEKIILSWFSDNPAACAVTLSNFHFNLSMKNGQDLNPQAENVGNCIIGVRFKKDNQVFTKLLITKETTKHQCLLDINSPLGEQLLKMELNEVNTDGLQDIELLEILPPYVAALQISLELRQVQNDGSDCFYAFNLPKEPDKIVDFFKQKLCKEKESDIVENTDIPLIFKGHYLHPNAPIKGALEQFLTKKINKSLLPNFGEDSFSEVVLDIYAVMYLAITGFAFGIEDNSIRFVITKETKYVIEQWLQEIKNENHSSLGIHDNGGLWLQSAEDIKKSTEYLQETLFYILSKTKVVMPLLADMPHELLRIQDLIDYSVYSSIKLSISNDIPWFSLDGISSHLLISCGGRVVNTVTLLTKIGSTLSFEQKKEGLYQYALETLPYALTFQDLSLLTLSNDEHAHYFLAKIISFHPQAFTETKSAVDFWSDLLAPVLAKAYIDNTFLHGLKIHDPRNNGYTERVFNACSYVVMQCHDNYEAELAFSMLLCRLIHQFRPIPTMINLICVLASAFSTGHFLSISRINGHIATLLKTKV